MNLVYQMKKGEGIDLAGSGRRSPDVDTSDCPILTKDNGTTCQGIKIAGVADSDPGNIGNRVKSLHWFRILPKPEERCQMILRQYLSLIFPQVFLGPDLCVKFI